jgi:hypothetical protein
MKTFWSGLVAASFVATVGLSAQQPPPGGGAPGAPGAPGGQKPAPAPSAQASTSKVTLSGCIQDAPPAAAGAASDAKFVLASAKMVGAGGAPGGAVGTTGSASRYELDGEDKAISPHVNHQVEVTGTIEPTSAAAGAKPAAPTFKVESVKMVAAKCS